MSRVQYFFIYCFYKKYIHSLFNVSEVACVDRLNIFDLNIYLQKCYI